MVITKQELSRQSFTKDGTFRLMVHTIDQGVHEYVCQDYRGHTIRHEVNPKKEWDNWCLALIKEAQNG